jgi:hypothetical protein
VAARSVGLNPIRDMDVSLVSVVCSGRGLCDGLITRLEESYGVWCVLSVIMKPQQ